MTTTFTKNKAANAGRRVVVAAAVASPTLSPSNLNTGERDTGYNAAVVNKGPN